jgi:hypothetical protein
MRCHRQVNWSSVVWYSEVASTLNSKDAYEVAIGQASTRADEILKQHSDRNHVIALLVGCDSIEVWYFSRDGAVYRSTPLSVGPTDSPGTQLLLRLFYSLPEAHFGFITPRYPSPFTLDGRQQVDGFKALRPFSHAQRSALVYSALVDGQPAVVKCIAGRRVEDWHEVR